MKFKIKNMKKFNRVNIIFYVIGCFMLLFALFNLYNVHQYITSLISSGQLDLSQQMKQVVTTYLEACLPYIFYACCLFGIGYVISFLNIDPSALPLEVHQSHEKEIKEDSEEEIDQFLKTIS